MHGGDIYRNKVELDFSINVNPLEQAAGVREAFFKASQKCAVYPDICQEELKNAIAGYTGAKADEIICGNGASELFMAVVHALRPQKVLFPVPSFSGYERAACAAGAKIVCCKLKEACGFVPDESFCESITDDIDLLFLANPNNPTGAVIEPKLLEKILGICREKQVSVVLDEAFIEFTGAGRDASLFHRTKEFPGLIAVRALTKFYALPGVRLGYLTVSDKGLKKKIAAQLPEWNVSVFAQEVGTAAIKETESYAKALEILKSERGYLEKELSGLGLKVYPSDANFIMFYSERPLYEELLARGILIRDCSDYRSLKEGYYRVAVKFHEDNERLIKAIGDIINDR